MHGRQSWAVIECILPLLKLRSARPHGTCATTWPRNFRKIFSMPHKRFDAHRMPGLQNASDGRSGMQMKIKSARVASGLMQQTARLAIVVALAAGALAQPAKALETSDLAGWWIALDD